ncbi:response regulator transcription factor [Streptomyces caniscabiei]|uniref:response regulator transcription factor n=1 Tax=Streptomyces caniscabiei TaxID=2746961 RepID=UPI00301050AC
MDAVRTVHAGDTLLDPSVTRALVERFVLDGRGARAEPDAAERARLRALTAREAQVLRLIAEGLSNAELAAVLGIAESTAKTHVKRILHKIGARDRAQAVVLAHRSGLMESRGAPTDPLRAPTDPLRAPTDPLRSPTDPFATPPAQPDFG